MKSETVPHQKTIVDPQPGGSTDDHYDLVELRQREQVHQPQEIMPEERADQFIREAEAAKASIFPPKGKDSNVPYHFMAQMDEDYLVVGNHVDEGTRAKIVRGEYIDFSKLLPKDRILTEEDGRMELIVKNGRTYWAPVNEAVSINGFAR